MPPKRNLKHPPTESTAEDEPGGAAPNSIQSQLPANELGAHEMLKNPTDKTMKTRSIRILKTPSIKSLPSTGATNVGTLTPAGSKGRRNPTSSRTISGVSRAGSKKKVKKKKSQKKPGTKTPTETLYTTVRVPSNGELSRMDAAQGVGVGVQAPPIICSKKRITVTLLTLLILLILLAVMFARPIGVTGSNNKSTSTTVMTMRMSTPTPPSPTTDKCRALSANPKSREAGEYCHCKFMDLKDCRKCCQQIAPMYDVCQRYC